MGRARGGARRRLQHAGGAGAPARLARGRSSSRCGAGSSSSARLAGGAASRAGGARRARASGGRQRARGARLRRGRPPARRDRGARAGTCATRPGGFRLVPQDVTREHVYGRRPVREALRGPREVLELLGDRARAAAPSRGCARRAPRVQVKPERELTEAAGTRDHQGVSPGASRTATPTRYELAARRAAAARLPRPGHRPAQPRRGDPQRRGRRRDRRRRARRTAPRA